MNTLQSMVSRNLKIDHRFVCVTDDPSGIACDTVPLWDEPKIILPRGKPNCYRRLKAFAPDAKDIFGTEWLLSLDLDTVIVDDITDLVTSKMSKPFTIWGDTAKNTLYNGSMWLLKLGSHPDVWTDLPRDPHAVTRARNIIGSDQAWISHKLGPGQPTWGTSDGVYSYRVHLKSGLTGLPDNAKIVFFHGRIDPWDNIAKAKSPWISDFYK